MTEKASDPYLLAQQLFNIKWCRTNFLVPLRVEQDSVSGSRVVIIAISDTAHLEVFGDFVKNRLSREGYQCKFIVKEHNSILALLEDRTGTEKKIDKSWSGSDDLASKGGTESIITDTPIDSKREKIKNTFFGQDAKYVLLFMFLSGGIYSLWWSYRFWNHLKQMGLSGAPLYPKDPKIRPRISAILGNIYLLASCRRIEREIRRHRDSNYKLYGLPLFMLNIALPVLLETLSRSSLIDYIWSFIGTWSIGTFSIVWVQHNANKANNLAGSRRLIKVVNKTDYAFSIWGLLILTGLMMDGDQRLSTPYA